MIYTELQNPVWNALSTTQAAFGEGNDLAKRFLPDFAPFVTILEPSKQAFEALSDILKPGGVGAWFTSSKPSIPNGWKIVFQSEVLRMVCENPQPVPKLELQLLTQNDLPAMLELVALTKPGPFSERTIELGDYYGIFANQQLVAMTGERLKMPGFTEISTVCTHPDFQSRGYAKALLHHVASTILARGEIPFLHVMAENTNAIKTYQTLGFTTNCHTEVLVLKAPK